MDLQTIKNHLSITQILEHYGLKPSKNNMLHCPFHDDKTPSLQIYPKTNTAYCFSSNCRTHGKSMDVIDFILHKETCTKHQAILKAKAMVNGELSMVNAPIIPTSKPMKTTPQENPAAATRNLATAYFHQALPYSKTARGWLKERGLDYRFIRHRAGYNGGKLHWKEKAPKSRTHEQWLKELEAVHLIKPLAVKGHQVWAEKCLIFELRDEKNEIVSFYGRSVSGKSKAGRGKQGAGSQKSKAGSGKHFYTKNRCGLYPSYPHRETRTLILTESIIDAVSLEQALQPEKGLFILACYGINGFTEEHQAAINQLTELEEVVFCFDGDEAGRKGIMNVHQQLQEAHPALSYSYMELPNEEDANSILQAHEAEVFEALMENRKAVPARFSFSNEKKTTEQNPVNQAASIENTAENLVNPVNPVKKNDG